MTEKQQSFERDFYVSAHARPTAVFGSIGNNRRSSAFKNSSDSRGARGNGTSRGHTAENERARARRGGRKVDEARRSAGERKRTVHRRRALVLFAVCVLLLALIAGVIYRFLFVVKYINISGSSVYSSDEIMSAGGLSEGVNLYSFRSSTLESSVTFRCPYISHLTLDRQLPDTVNISATEETARYYAVIYGEYKLLSDSLRVLGTVTQDALPEGLIKLKLPTVSYAVTGRQIAFASERRMSDIKQLLSDISQSELADRLNIVDVRDKYDVRALCDGLRLLLIGENADTSYKLRVAARVLEDEMFAENEKKYRVDLTVRGKTGVLEIDDVGLD